VAQQALVGNVSHEEYIKTFMSFIQYIIYNSNGKIVLLEKHAEKLYSLFVINANSDLESSLIFKLFTDDYEELNSAPP
jgi:hypothetical protein